jgi:serine/threonine protein kinase
VNTPLRLQPGLTLRTQAGETVLVERWRGEGSYARVYRAMLTQSGTPCALKVAKAEIPDSGDWLEAERAVLERVRHPHLARALGAGAAGQSPFLLLEWLDGDTLLDLVDSRRRLPLRQALEILQPLAEALAAIHAERLAHADLRAQNVVVTTDRGAMLADPGRSDASVALTVRQHEDVRQLGGLLYLMLTGRSWDPAAPPLSAANGFNRAVVELWTRCRANSPATASELAGSIAQLRRTL